MVLRRVTGNDAPALHRLICEAALAEECRELVFITVEALRSDVDEGVVSGFVWDDPSDGVVGSALLTRLYNDRHARHYLYLDDLSVSSTHRNQGLGRKLLDSCLQAAKEEGAERLSWQCLKNNEAAMRLYRRLEPNICGESSNVLLRGDALRKIAAEAGEGPVAVSGLANHDECVSLATLIRQLAIVEKFPEADVTVTSQALQRDALETVPPRFRALIAKVRDEVVGAAVYVFPSWASWRGRRVHLRALVVDEHHRKQGVGRALVRHLARFAVESGQDAVAWEVYRWNEPALNFYKGIGADIDSTGEWYNCSYYVE